MGHDGCAVLSHDAFTVLGGVGAAGGLGGEPVAAQVEEDAGVVGEEVGGDEVPDGEVLGEAV